MIHGFDESLTCEGIVGDGCGGGRFFTVDENTLKAYDPQTEETIILLQNVYNAKSISKKGCSLFVECENEKFEFDLPSMSKVVKKI